MTMICGSPPKDRGDDMMVRAGYDMIFDLQ